MNTNNRITEFAETRAKLSTLWIFIMLNMIFADIYSFMHPGALAQIMSGYAGEMQITPEFLLAAAALTEIPIAMVVLSRVLGYRLNRIANLVAAVITILFVVGGGSMTPTYIFFAAIQVATMLYITWFAWRWRNPETVSTSAALRTRVPGGQS